MHFQLRQSSYQSISRSISLLLTRCMTIWCSPGSSIKTTVASVSLLTRAQAADARSKSESCKYDAVIWTFWSPHSTVTVAHPASCRS